jgi:SAM-dependent methyltransferase
MRDDLAKLLLAKTCQDYNLIAQHFSRTRQFVWDLEPLAEYVKAKERVLDLGCGNGRLLEILKDKDIDYFGVDISEKLIEIAKKRYPGANFQVADVLNLPFANNFFDKVFAIRIFHHIPSQKLRLQFLKEVRRVLKPGGFLVLTVWNVWGSKHKKNLLRVIKYGLLKIIGKSKLDFKDAFIPWRLTEGRVLRYFHFFTKRELRKILKRSSFEVKKVWTFRKFSHSDIYLVAKK